jgi:hypothetical protein
MCVQFLQLYIRQVLYLSALKQQNPVWYALVTKLVGRDLSQAIDVLGLGDVDPLEPWEASTDFPSAGIDLDQGHAV